MLNTPARRQPRAPYCPSSSPRGEGDVAAFGLSPLGEAGIDTSPSSRPSQPSVARAIVWCCNRSCRWAWSTARPPSLKILMRDGFLMSRLFG